MSKVASDDTRRVYRGFWNLWIDWLKTQKGWEDASAEKLIEKQENSNGKGRYEVLDLVQRHVKEHGGTRKTMLFRYQVLRSFFLHNRCDLPRDRFDVGPGTRPSVQGSLTVEKIKRIIESAGLRDRAVFLSIWQGLLDQERFIQFNDSYGEQLSNHLKDKGVDTPFRIDFAYGRKKNYQPYFTFLGHDALNAWKEYLDKERGYPAKDEPIALIRGHKKAVNKPAIKSIFAGLAFRAGLKTKKDRGRVGVTIHQFRHVARSTLQLAKRDGFDETCAEFFMGHRIDPLGYNKFTELNPEYVLENYKIAEKHLNILTGNTTTDSEAQTRIKELEDRLTKLEKVYTKKLEVKAE